MRPTAFRKQGQSGRSLAGPCTLETEEGGAGKAAATADLRPADLRPAHRDYLLQVARPVDDMFLVVPEASPFDRRFGVRKAVEPPVMTDSDDFEVR